MENEKILLKDRTVAFLDILAFKQILNKYPCINIGKAYLSAVTSSKERTKEWMYRFSHKYIECEFHTFSDSVLILSPDDSKAGFLSVSINFSYRIIG